MYAIAICAPNLNGENNFCFKRSTGTNKWQQNQESRKQLKVAESFPTLVILMEHWIWRACRCCCMLYPCHHQAFHLSSSLEPRLKKRVQQWEQISSACMQDWRSQLTDRSGTVLNLRGLTQEGRSLCRQQNQDLHALSALAQASEVLQASKPKT